MLLADGIQKARRITVPNFVKIGRSLRRYCDFTIFQDGGRPLRENGEKLGKNPTNLLLIYCSGNLACSANLPTGLYILIFFAQGGGQKGAWRNRK